MKISFVQLVCQIAHFLAGYAITLTIYVLYPSHWAPVASLVVISWAGVKEFLYDPEFEDAPIVWSGITDFTFYIAGLCVGLLFCAFH